MQVRSAKAALRPNLTRRSITGMTRPRRLMTPRTNSGICGTGVIFCIRMISRTFSTATPYDSLSRATVKYLPAKREPLVEAAVARGELIKKGVSCGHDGVGHTFL